MAGEEAAMAFGGRACSMTTVHCGATDRVAERWTGRGTHRGELQGIAPTGRRVEVPGSVFYRIVDGKIVEFRGQLDMMGLMQQLGVIASPQQAEA